MRPLYFSYLSLKIYKMDPPMSDWFRTLPHAIDGIANTVKVRHSAPSFLGASCLRSFSKNRLLLSCDIIETSACNFLPPAIDYEMSAGR